MKKLIALMLCAMLLLSGCAAVTEDGPGVGFQVSDPVVTSHGEAALDLTGLTAGFESAQTDSASGVRCAIRINGEDAGDVILAIVGQYLYLSLPGAAGIHSYALDLVKVSQAISDAAEGISKEIAGIIPAIFPGTDVSNLFGTGEPSADEVPEMSDEEPEAAFAEMTDEELEAAFAEMTDEEQEAAIAELEEAMAGLEEAMAGLEDSGEALDEYAEDEADVPEAVGGMSAGEEAIYDKLSEMMERCMTDTPTEIGGETFDVVTMDITAEDMAELFDLIPLNEMTGVTLGQVLTVAGVSVALEGVITANAEFTRYSVDLTPSITTGSGVFGLRIAVGDMEGDGTVSAAANGLRDGQPAGGFSMAFTPVVVEEADWLPAELAEDTVILTEMSLQEAGDALEAGFSDYIALFQQFGFGAVGAGQAG